MVTNSDLGAAVTRARGSMTQIEFASRMKLMGHSWAQATVWAVETGKRPLRLAEAIDVAHVLDVDLNTLVGGAQPSVSRVHEEVAEAQSAFEEALDRLIVALKLLRPERAS